LKRQANVHDKLQRDQAAKIAASARYYWCRVRGLNSRPTVYKTAALPLS
jgi:hypothetical protein